MAIFCAGLFSRAQSGYGIRHENQSSVPTFIGHGLNDGLVLDYSLPVLRFRRQLDHQRDVGRHFAGIFSDRYLRGFLGNEQRSYVRAEFRSERTNPYLGIKCCLVFAAKQRKVLGTKFPAKQRKVLGTKFPAKQRENLRAVFPAKQREILRAIFPAKLPIEQLSIFPAKQPDFLSDQHPHKFGIHERFHPGRGHSLEFGFQYLW